MPLTFDDLIPQSGAGAPAAGQNVSFDDLIPPEKASDYVAGGIIKSGLNVLGLPVRAANALGKAVAAATGAPQAPDIQIGSPGWLQDKFEKYVTPLPKADTPEKQNYDLAGQVLPAAAGGIPGLAAAGAGYLGSYLGGKATEGTPYQDLAELGGGLAGGIAGAKVAPGSGAAVPKVTSAGLTASGADPAVIARVQALEKLQRQADRSAQPANVALPAAVDDMSAAERAQFSPATNASLDDLASTGPSANSGFNNKEWSTKELVGLAFPPTMPFVLGAKAINRVRRGMADSKAKSAFEQIKADAAAEPPPTPAPTPPPGPGPTGPSVPLQRSPWDSPTNPAPTQPLPSDASPWGPRPPQPSVPQVAPAPPPSNLPDPMQLKLQMQALVNQRRALAASQPAPVAPASGLPDPTQLKLQMDKLVNERAVLAKAQAAQQPAPAPPAPPELNPLALPTSITTPAKNIMGGASNVAGMKAASDPLAKYDAAVKANDSIDRQGNAALKADATGLTAARKAAQAAEDAAAEPPEPDPLKGQIAEATQLMAARKANAKLAAAQAKAQAPVAPADMAAIAQRMQELSPDAPPAPPPAPVKISKKNGAVKETQKSPEEQLASAQATAAKWQPILKQANQTNQPDVAARPTAAPQPPPPPPDLPRADFAHLPPQAIADLVIARMKAEGKVPRTSYADTHAAVLKRTSAQGRIASDLHNAVPTEEYQNVIEHVKGADSRAAAAEVRDHYIKLHPEAADAIRLALSEDRMKLGWKK
jgi:hypothetical protein